MILVLTPDRDTPGRSDWRGAFQPEADAFLARHGGTLVRIDQGQNQAGRFRQTLAAIEEDGGKVNVEPSGSASGEQSAAEVTRLASLPLEDRCKEEWDRNIRGCRDEFTSLKAYTAFKRAEAGKRAA